MKEKYIQVNSSCSLKLILRLNAHQRTLLLGFGDPSTLLCASLSGNLQDLNSWVCLEVSLLDRRFK